MRNVSLGKRKMFAFGYIQIKDYRTKSKSNRPIKADGCIDGM
jgi:hypothetical protein